MKNKTVIITGASSGIGKAIAKYFIERESNVIMNSSNEQRLRKTFEEFGSPSNASYFAGDISKRATGQQLVAMAIEKFK